MTVGPGALVGGEKGAAAGAALAVGQMPKIQAGLALYIDKMKRSPMADVYFDNNRLTAAGRLAIVNAIKTQEELEWSDYYSK